MKRPRKPTPALFTWPREISGEDFNTTSMTRGEVRGEGPQCRFASCDQDQIVATFREQMRQVTTYSRRGTGDEDGLRLTEPGRSHQRPVVCAEGATSWRAIVGAAPVRVKSVADPSSVRGSGDVGLFVSHGGQTLA